MLGQFLNPSGQDSFKHLQDYKHSFENHNVHIIVLKKHWGDHMHQTGATIAKQRREGTATSLVGKGCGRSKNNSFLAVLRHFSPIHNLDDVTWPTTSPTEVKTGKLPTA